MKESRPVSLTDFGGSRQDRLGRLTERRKSKRTVSKRGRKKKFNREEWLSKNHKELSIAGAFQQSQTEKVRCSECRSLFQRSVTPFPLIPICGKCESRAPSKPSLCPFFFWRPSF